MIPIAGFAPDMDTTTPGVMLSVTNLVPSDSGYRADFTPVDVGMSALAATCKGAIAVYQLSKTTDVFAGSATKLYQRNGTSWSDVSRVAAYNVGTDARWRFAQFGSSTIAANKGDVLQRRTTGNFADLTAPKASCIESVNGFVMVADTNEVTYGDDPARWWCSAYLDETDWTPAVATQCTTGELVETVGPIVGLRKLGRDVVAYKDSSMYLGQYVGAPVVWQWSLLSDSIGARSQEAVVNIGTAHIFIGKSDIFMFDGARPVSIGAGVREWFFANLKESSAHLIAGLHDSVRGLVYFFYPSNAGVGAVDSSIVYNYKNGKWGHITQTIEVPIEYVTATPTIDGLTGTIDTLPDVPFDSPYWTASSKQPAIFKTDHKIYGLTGTAGSSGFTTGDMGDDANYSALTAGRIKFSTTPTSATGTNYYKNDLGGSLTLDGSTSYANGKFDFLRTAKWHRLVFAFTGDVEFSAMRVDLKQDGGW